MGETPLVNCGPRSYSLHSIQSTANIVLYCSSHTNIIFHTIHLILCYSKPVRLTTSLFRWGKVLWLCCAGSTLAPESLVLRRITFRDHQPSTCFLAPPGSINLGFFLRENLLLCASYLPLGVPNERVSYTPSHNIKLFSGTVAGGVGNKENMYLQCKRKDRGLLSADYRGSWKSLWCNFSFDPRQRRQKKSLMACNTHVRWEPQEEGMLHTVASFSSERNQGY